jgi:hypothetical protein
VLSNRQRLSLACTILLSSAPAFAYIDPGTGSALIQGIIAAIAAIGVTLKLYWHRIVKFFTRKNAAESDLEDQSE